MQVSSPWFCLGVIQIGTFYGFTGEGATPSPTSRPLQLKAILLPHSPWGRKSCPPWSKQFSQDEPRSPDTSSPGCPHVHQGVWHVISYLDTTRRTVGQEPGSLFWVGVRARFRNGLGEQSVWGFCPCDWEYLSILNNRFFITHFLKNLLCCNVAGFSQNFSLNCHLLLRIDK